MSRTTKKSLYDRILDALRIDERKAVLVDTGSYTWAQVDRMDDHQLKAIINTKRDECRPYVEAFVVARIKAG